MKWISSDSHSDERECDQGEKYEFGKSSYLPNTLR